MGGRIAVAGCPWQQVPDDVWQLLQAERLSRLGLMPVSGGWLEQTEKFIEGIEYVRRVMPPKHEDRDG